MNESKAQQYWVCCETHRNTHPLMPGRHFLIKPAVCRAVEMKELFFPFLWDSRSQSSHALQQGLELSALYGAYGCECPSEIVAHICIILQTNNAASSREQSVSLRSFMLDVILRCVNICVWYVLKQPSSLSWYYLCNYHRRRWKRRKLERLRWRRERDRGRKKCLRENKWIWT